MENLSVKELHKLCRNEGFKNFQKLRKNELIDLLKTINKPESNGPDSNKLDTFINNISNKYNIPIEELKNIYDNGLKEDNEIKEEIIQKKEINDFKINDNFKDIIKHCIYSNKKSKPFRDKSSLSSLVDSNVNQSECIKMGIALEKILSNTITKYGDNLEDIKNIKKKNKKGEKEKIIYYAELKANLNLDTEKSKSTFLKCIQIKKELEIEYPEYKIEMCLVGLRYFNKDEIPRIIMNKYINIKDNIYGIDDYLSLLNLENLKFNNENNYKYFINYVYNNLINQ